MLKNRVSVSFCLLLLCVMSLNAFQVNEQIVQFSDMDRAYKVNDFVSVYQTPDTISAQEAWRRIQAGTLEEVPYQGNPGMTNSDVAYWLVFQVYNSLTDNAQFYLELSYPQLDAVSLSEIHGESAKLLFATGDKFKFSQRPVDNRNFVFPISIPSKEQKTFLLNADKRNSAVRFPLRLYSQSHFLETANREQIYLSVYYIFLAVLVISSLMVGLGLSNKVFVWYAVSVFCYGLWLFTWQGFSYQYITSNWPEFNRHFLPFCSQIAIMSLLIFVQSFFETKNTLPAFNRIMNGVLLLFVLGTVVWVIIPNTYVAFAPRLFALRYFCVGLILVFSVTAAIKYRKQGMNRSVIFAISYALFFITIVGKILDEYGLIAEFNFVVDPILIGNLMQVIGLSVAMMIMLIKVLREKELLKTTNMELARSLEQTKREASEEPLAPKFEYLTLKSKAVINLADIEYISSDGGYCEFYIRNKEHPEIDRRSLTSLEDDLPEYFVRIHRSTIINLNHARQVKSSAVVLTSGVKLVVSRTYKEALLEAAGKS